MKTISVKHGIILLDDGDFPIISKYCWCSHKDGNVFYAVTKVKIGDKRVQIKLHHLILPCPAGMQTDHIDGDGLNNQRSNLQIVTHRQNQWNQHVNKTSKYPGVCFDKKSKKYISGIKVNGVRKSLGSFTNEFEAFKTYVVASSIITRTPTQEQKP